MTQWACRVFCPRLSCQLEVPGRRLTVLTKLVLFDIDGTLLDAGDLSRRSFLYVVRRFAGPGAALGRYSLSGKTDPQIMKGLLLQNGVPAKRADELAEEALDSYQSHYLSELKQADVRPLEGARELIEGLASLATADVELGILTGNMRGLVAPKLRAVGISPASFRVVACGSDHSERDRLPALAVERALRHHRVGILPGDVVIVGDTPLDVRCAQHFGALSVAVATGDYTYEQLRASKPAYLLTSLLAWSDVENEIGLPVMHRPLMNQPHPSRLGSTML
jgi:phosphoglycolate phosphatase